MRILAIAAVLLLSAFPAMAATSSMVEVNADALKTLVMGYLYPSKTAPGDVFSAIQELEREVQEAQTKQLSSPSPVGQK